jgi:uncharacterized protein YktB (UPF0637 family)
MSNSNFKLQLSEDERDIWLEIMHNSDAHKVIFKVLDQLIKLNEKNLLSRVQDGTDKVKNDICLQHAEIQGMHKIIKLLAEVRTRANDRTAEKMAKRVESKE